MIKFSLLRTPTEAVRREINGLTPQLTPNGGSTSKQEFNIIVRDPNNAIIIARDGKVLIGMGMLVLIRTPLKLRSRIECVVVEEGYRGKGIGSEILKRLIVIAKKKKALDVSLMAGSAHATKKELAALERFYHALGFEKTNNANFRLLFSS